MPTGTTVKKDVAPSEEEVAFLEDFRQIFAIDVASNGEVSFYDSNLNQLNTIYPTSVYTDAVDKSSKIVLSPSQAGDYGIGTTQVFKIFGDEPQKTNNYLLHTKNCRCSLICEDFLELDNPDSIVFRDYENVVIPYWTTNDEFNIWLKYQHADNRCTD